MIAEAIKDVLTQLAADVKEAWNLTRLVIDDPAKDLPLDKLPNARITMSALSAENSTPTSDRVEVSFDIGGQFEVPKDVNSTMARLNLASELREQVYQTEQAQRATGYGGHAFLVLVESMMDDADPVNKAVMQVSAVVKMSLEVDRY